MLLAVCHSAKHGWQQVDNLDRVSDLRAEPDSLLWAETDVANITQEDMNTIAEEFSLHELAVEDALHARQRPKSDRFSDHIFVVFHQLDEIHGQLESSQLACFVGDRYLLTVHAGAQRTLDAAKDRWEHLGDDAHDPFFLLHTLLDVVVDDYQQIADRLEREMEDLEELVLEQPELPIQRQLYEVKQQLARLRRYVLPASRMMPDLTEALRDGRRVRELLRDVEDHLLRISDQIKNIDELAQAVLDLTMAAKAQDLNEVNRMLAAWAAIFAVGTLIAGVYGMNFALVPNEGSLFGFWFAVALMVVCSVGLWVNFKRRGWL